jgi:hypothetical protein
VTFQGGDGMAAILNYPAFILSRPEKGHPLTKSLEVLGFPFAHPVVPLGTGPKFTPLDRTSAYSWIPSELRSIDPNSLRRPTEQDAHGPFTLAAAVEGSTRSFSDPNRTANVRMVVVGTDYFLDAELPSPPGNADFLARLAEWMVQDEDFQSIPSKGAAFRPLRPVHPALRGFFKAAGYFFLPALIVLWGFLRWRDRRLARPSIEKAWRESLRA